MAGPPETFGDMDRLRFIADAEVLDALGLQPDDLRDRDVRALVIRHEHPELGDALEADLDEVDLGHGPVNPRLHLAMHEIVATQLWEDSPPEVWQTAVRLHGDGYDRHEILHMIGRPVSDQIWAALHDQRPYDESRHIAALRALPASWERERSGATGQRLHSDGRKQARRRSRAARRRNRRPG